MPNSKTHDRATIIFSPIVVGGVFWFDLELNATVTFIALYFFSSFMFNGDLDVISKPYNRWGFIKFLWIPYQKMFSHRSIWTHGILIGTTIRLFYLGVLFSPVILLDVVNLQEIFTTNLEFFIIIFLGLESGSIVHTTLDYTI